MIGLRYNQDGTSIKVTYALAETTTEITEADARIIMDATLVDAIRRVALKFKVSLFEAKQLVETVRSHYKETQSHKEMAQLTQCTDGFSVIIHAAPGARIEQPRYYYLTFPDVKFIRSTGPSNALRYLQSQYSINTTDAELIVASVQEYKYDYQRTA